MMKHIQISADRKLNKLKGTNTYFNEIDRIKRLTIDQEVDLATRAKAGDKAAMDKLIEANLKFVVSVAKNYTSDPVLVQELIAQGNIGIIRAAQKFDPTRGFKFITYAVFWIRNEILEYYLKYNRVVHLPLHVENDLRKVKRVQAKLEQKFDRTPTLNEIEDELIKIGEPIDLDKLRLILEVKDHAVPLVTDDPESYDPIEWIEVKSETEVTMQQLEFREKIDEILEVLSPDERSIVRKRHGFDGYGPMEFEAIGIQHGKGTGWASQRYAIAMRKMRAKLHLINSSEEITFSL